MYAQSICCILAILIIAVGCQETRKQEPTTIVCD